MGKRGLNSSCWNCHLGKPLPHFFPISIANHDHACHTYIFAYHVYDITLGYEMCRLCINTMYINTTTYAALKNEDQREETCLKVLHVVLYDVCHKSYNNNTNKFNAQFTYYMKYKERRQESLKGFCLRHVHPSGCLFFFPFTLDSRRRTPVLRGKPRNELCETLAKYFCVF